MGARRAFLIREAATQALAKISEDPRSSHWQVITVVLRQIMLDTGGELVVDGGRWEIKKKSLGAGVYQIFLTPLDTD